MAKESGNPQSTATKRTKGDPGSRTACTSTRVRFLLDRDQSPLLIELLAALHHPLDNITGMRVAFGHVRTRLGRDFAERYRAGDRLDDRCTATS